MIIKASKYDRDFLKEQLLKLCNGKINHLSNASETAIQSGISTLTEPFSVNRALLKRAMEQIRDTISTEDIEQRRYVFACQDDEIKCTEQEERDKKIDSIGPELVEEVFEMLPF